MRPTSLVCPACRVSPGRVGFLFAIVGAEMMPLDEAPANISWPLKCRSCGYQDPFGYVANPVPAICREIPHI